MSFLLLSNERKTSVCTMLEPQRTTVAPHEPGCSLTCCQAARSHTTRGVNQSSVELEEGHSMLATNTGRRGRWR